MLEIILSGSCEYFGCVMVFIALFAVFIGLCLSCFKFDFRVRFGRGRRFGDAVGWVPP